MLQSSACTLRYVQAENCKTHLHETVSTWVPDNLVLFLYGSGINCPIVYI